MGAGRDRSGPVPARLPDGAGGAGLEAPGQHRAGRFDRWVKVKNRKHPAYARVMEAFG